MIKLPRPGFISFSVFDELPLSLYERVIPCESSLHSTEIRGFSIPSNAYLRELVTSSFIIILTETICSSSRCIPEPVISTSIEYGAPDTISFVSSFNCSMRGRCESPSLFMRASCSLYTAAAGIFSLSRIRYSLFVFPLTNTSVCITFSNTRCGNDNSTTQ